MSARTATSVRLAVDAGQTGTKIRVEGDGRPKIDRVYPGVRTHEPLLPQLARIAEALHDEVGARLDVISLGVSGLTGPDADAAHLLSMLGTLGTRQLLLTHDSVTSFLGSLGDRRGAVIAAGTGVVTLGVGATRVARVDGWGNIMGDAGSAYWIGRQALEAAMRAYDGRGAPTALTEVVRDRWPNIEDAYIDLQSDPDRVSVVASFAASVTALAATDAAAAQISLNAARELSRSVVAALEKVADPLDPDAPEYVSAVGGVFRSPEIRRRFEELTGEARPHVHIEDARGTGLDGAALLPSLPAEHPLRGHISVATITS